MVTNIEALLIAIFSGVAIISSIMIWKVFDDCRKRRERLKNRRKQTKSEEHQSCRNYRQTYNWVN